eukprot:COSAG01_NODE_507_length_16108_cov_18.603973_12_plen_144_part_00
MYILAGTIVTPTAERAFRPVDDPCNLNATELNVTLATHHKLAPINATQMAPVTAVEAGAETPTDSRLCPGGMSADSTYFWLGIGFASCLAMVTKLLAITGQQKLIGGLLGSRASVVSRSIFLDKNRGHIGESQSKRPPKMARL